jgi:uncharacterized protein
MSGSLAEETWVVTQGAAGMENQCLGLAERLPFSVRIFRTQLKKPWRWLAPHSFGSPFTQATDVSDRLASPWPRILIGCGRQSIPFSRAVKWASGGRTITIQCQDPRIGTGNFDLVIPAEHDKISGTNVFPIVGSPNRVTPARLAEARMEFEPIFEPLRTPRIAVLIGGTSRTHGSLDMPGAEHLGTMLAQIAPNHSLMVSTSRRTGREEAMMLRRQLTKTGAFVWNGDGENPYLAMLAWADAFVVTADSVNMICEAAATGKPIHVFPLPGGRHKAQAFQRSLAERGITRPFKGKIAQWSYRPLDETGRAVERIKALLDLGVAPSDMQGQGP